MSSDQLVIIPAYNEELSLGSTLDSLIVTRVPSTLLVVDDGSSDQTLAIAESRGVSAIRLPTNKGYSQAISHGMKWAIANSRATKFATFDADGQIPVEALNECFRIASEGNFDVVLGLRSQEKCRMVENFISRGIALLSVGESYPDYLCGLKVYDSQYVQKMFETPAKNFLNFVWAALAFNISGSQIDIYASPRPSRFGSTHKANLKILKTAMVACVEILRLRFKEMRR